MTKTKQNRHYLELRKDAVLLQLSAGKSVAQIAREMNLNASHIRDWLRSDEAVQRVQCSIDESRQILENRLPGLIGKSLDTLEDALSCPFMSDSKMLAARTILQTITRLSKNQNPCPHCEKSVVDVQ